MIFLFYCTFFLLLIHVSSDNLIMKSIDKFITISNTFTEYILLMDPIINADTDLSIEEFLYKYHYPLEKHKVTTEDGYILTLHRIPHSKNQNLSILTNQTKPVVLLKHAFMGSSMNFIIVGPDKSLPLQLADSGYDVWLINSRGNRYSRNHIKYDSAYNSAKFWNFSFHEKGYYDLASSIDYVTDKTEQKNISLIGHSQGVAESLILLSTRPEYNEKLNLFVMFAPVTHMIKIRTLFFQLAFLFRKELEALFNFFKIYGVPHNKLIGKLVKTYCNDASPLQGICVDFTQSMYGYHYSQFNRTLLAIMATNIPSGNSIKEIQHYSQHMESGKFHHYDYNEMNHVIYNSTSPPAYNLSKVTIPTAVYYGRNDFAAHPQVVQKMLKQLPNVVENHLNDFNNVDFLYAINVKTLLYDKVIELIKKYNPLISLRVDLIK